MKKTKKTFSFDLDNTICKTNSNNYLKSKPYKKVIKLINKLYDNGHSIKIFTARYMGRNNDNILKANKIGYKETVRQLKKWKLKYSKLFISKPSADIYIDDKSYGYNKKWLTDFKKYL
tara:strand:+ start:319 stop:672 length:354 start_codon:yes stop_codon:yes gene_type:complete